MKERISFHHLAHLWEVSGLFARSNPSIREGNPNCVLEKLGRFPGSYTRLKGKPLLPITALFKPSESSKHWMHTHFLQMSQPCRFIERWMHESNCTNSPHFRRNFRVVSFQIFDMHKLMSRTVFYTNGYSFPLSTDNDRSSKLAPFYSSYLYFLHDDRSSENLASSIPMSRSSCT